MRKTKKKECNKKEEGADYNGDKGVITRLLDFVRRREIQQPAIALPIYDSLNSYS